MIGGLLTVRKIFATPRGYYYDYGHGLSLYVYGGRGLAMFISNSPRQPHLLIQVTVDGGDTSKHYALNLLSLMLANLLVRSAHAKQGNLRTMHPA